MVCTEYKVYKVQSQSGNARLLGFKAQGIFAVLHMVWVGTSLCSPIHLEGTQPGGLDQLVPFISGLEGIISKDHVSPLFDQPRAQETCSVPNT